MTVNRRDLLTASALLLAGPGIALRAGAREGAPTGPRVLCWNENPYGPSPAARRVMAASIAEGCRYPSEDELKSLIRKIALHEGTDSQHIVIGTGSGELLRALVLVCARDGGEIVAAQPTYLEMPEYAETLGVKMRFVPVDALLQHDLAAMQAAITPRTRAVYLCNPNNPTGTAVSAAAIREFIAALPPQVYAIVDEAYMDFVDAPGVGSAVDLVDGNRRVVVLRTFSKLHGMAGMRLGYAITRTDIATQLAAVCMTYPNIMVVRAGQASLADKAFLTDTRQRIVTSRTRITQQLAARGLNFARPQGNFVFFDTGIPLAVFAKRMAAHNILVGRLFPPFTNWCRVTIGTEADVSAFLGELPGALRA
jgi:histidinol-phosphate aminotransferase